MIQNLSMLSPEARTRRFEEEIESLAAQLREYELTGLDLDEYVDQEVEPAAASTDPLGELEALLTGNLFRPDPQIERAYRVQIADGERRITFSPEMLDAHPDTLRLMTFGQRALAEVLAQVPDPVRAEDGPGRVLRSEAEKTEVLDYYAPGEDDAVSIETLTALRRALDSGRELRPEDGARAGDHFAGFASAVARRTQAVEVQLATGELLARQEEARTLLRRAAAVDLALRARAGDTLFETETQPDLPFVPDHAVREFAKREAAPLAPLLVLLQPEQVTLRAETRSWRNAA